MTARFADILGLLEHRESVLGSLLVGGGIVLWLAPFLVAQRGSGSLAAVDRRARWGLLLEVVAIALMLQSPFWTATVLTWRTAASAACFLLAALLSLTATRALGRQLRFDAAIGSQHELVREGPYRVMRHPIYCSMLSLLWGIGFVAAPLWLFVVATIVFLVGTEIRVRIEDRLLAERFGEMFAGYRSSTRAYLPLIR
ncbi:methyltransferase family protein [Edaphobacter aggregans]|uniref:methyltransferase family protein n=1 Tax=Edaphobacter aggregans TaxID=570835 RepID=UPI0006918074|nr:isoprenylcysteine carboxylmethyltransferase family protein [Edaphobacter aggregans]